MRAILDISVLGASEYDQRSRTGIFRVVERVARGLAESPECELEFAAIQCLEGAVAYLQSHPEMQEVPFAFPKSRRALCSRLYHLNRKMAVAPESRQRDFGLRVVRSLLYRSEGLFGRIDNRRQGTALSQADIFHSPFFALPKRTAHSARRTAHGGLCAVRRAPCAARSAQRFLTVYDLTPLLFPHFFAYDEDQLVKGILASIEPEDWVLCISESCRQDLCGYLDIDPERVFVTHLAADRELFYPCADEERACVTRAKYGIPEAPYILSLSTLQPRKNLDHLIRCFGRVIRQEGMADLRLVLVGIRGWHEGPVFEAIAELGPLQDRVVLTGYVADEDLAPLYSGALAFAYPSFYEGFGLPPLEAMQCGVPVISSDTSSLPEVVGDAGIMLDPRDADGLCQAITDLYARPSLRARLARQSLARARGFSWEKCLEQTLQAYNVALSGVAPERQTALSVER